MSSAPTITIVLSALAVLLAGAASILAARLYAKAAQMAEPHRRFLESLGKMEFPEDLTAFLEMLGAVHRKVESNERRVDAVIEDLRGALTRVGLVRFDAFEHMGGMMSFALALLDDRGDGVIVTGIHARNTFDTYCRRVQAGAPETDISGEERQALDQALAGWARR